MFGGFDPELHPDGPNRAHTAVAAGMAPNNYSSEFAPAGLQPTLKRAAEAMLAAAAIWLQR